MSAPSIFTRMMRGELPARFVWSDDRVVALLSKAPLNPGHTLVVPRDEVDYWIDLEPALLQHIMWVAQEIARAIQRVFQPTKVGMIVAGLEVRHVHVHLSPINSLRDLEFDRQDHNADPAQLDAAAERIRAALREQGHAEVVPDL